MNYQKIYDQLIERAITENRKKSKDVYYERHHIIPECMGGTDDKDNLINLTAREHFIAHKLLHYIYPKNDKLFFAYYMMSNIKNDFQERNYYVSSYEYERLKKIFSEKMSNRTLSDSHKRKIGEASKGRTHTDVSKQKNREAHLGKPSPMKGRKHSEDAKEKNRQAHLGKIQSEETKQKTSDTLKGRVFSKETIAKMCASQTKRQQNKNKI
jgi:hypothetical protein